MISDIIFDAIVAIQKYQSDLPEAYDGYRTEIDAVVVQMDHLATRLLTLPFDEDESK